MAATAATRLSISVTAPRASAALAPTHCRRRITPQAGHALEILGHAIEYLTDEYVNEESAAFSAKNERVEAVQLLMALNRRVYFECPLAPTFGERCRSFLRAYFG
jgi:ABC-type nitrate/sulfonate/bicarbonate transport system substrate-binding protein